MSEEVTDIETIHDESDIDNQSNNKCGDSLSSSTHGDGENFTTDTEIEFSGTRDGFKRALSVYVNKPHVVNRRLCGAKTLYLKWHSRFDAEQIRYFTARFCEADNVSDEEKTTHANDQTDLDVDLDSYDDGVVIIVRDLIPKQIDKYPTLRELVCFDTSCDTAYFHPVCHVQTSPPHNKHIREELYQFTYKPGNPAQLHLSITPQASGSESGHVTSRWLTYVLLQKLARWGEEAVLRTATSSLRLVAVDEYNRLYNDLKVKYGHHFVEIWPEKTDPKKFVYEDVAIATYLLLIWKADRERKKTSQLQSFVDLGCGNGLLVHLLASEGHPGVGLDIRRRKIWDIYGSETVLKEQSVIPSADSLFPQYDWLIGNHSDELTPWIPLMAARSSYTCCYFVLPCCLHDFDSKYSVREKGSSPYRTYLNFVKEVGEVCGFQVEEDTLRIPSTKRVCFIGRDRTYSETAESVQDERRSEYVKGRCSKGGDNSDPESQRSKKPRLDNASGPETPWAAKFEPRNGTEPVRNCQRVAKETKQVIVQTVFNTILAAPDGQVVSLDDGKQWRKGGSLPLSEAAKLFDGEILQQLKAESGGLQTLLRNHNSIFQVSGGMVQLRDLSQANPWSQSRKARAKKDNSGDYYKTSLCWFHDHHPDGCPRSSEKCSFAHGQVELRQKSKTDT